MQGAMSVQDRAYDTLRKSILNFSLEPAASVTTQELADKLHVSRTPVREALIRLQRDGLVIVLPQRETIVSRINLDRVARERSMRRRLEQSVLETFVPQRSFEQLKQMSEMIEKQVEAGVNKQYAKLQAYDDDFHALMFEFVGESFSWEVLEQISTHYHRIRLLNLKVEGVPEQIILQHQAILRAIESGQPEAAQELLLIHLGELDQQLKGLIERYPAFIEAGSADEPELFTGGISF